MHPRRVCDRLAARTDDVLLYGLAGFALLAGVSKFVSPGVWATYTPRWAARLLPVTPTAWMYVVGVIEGGAGLLLLSRWKSHVWAGLLALWLAGVTVAVASTGLYDIALRDVGLVVFAAAVSLNEYRRGER